MYADSLDAMDPAGVLTAGVLTPGEDTICTEAVHRRDIAERRGSAYSTTVARGGRGYG